MFEAFFTRIPTIKRCIFNAKYVEEAVSFFKGQAGTYSILALLPAM